jgi:small subunit ribosomal protein S9
MTEETTTETPQEDPTQNADVETPVVEEAVPEPTPTPIPTGPDAHGWWRGTGRRKTAVARVRIKSGNGLFKINEREFESYFCEERDLNNINAVLEKTDVKGSIDIYVTTNGGGYMGQAGAVILGLGRALLKYDPALEPILRDNGFLTRDAREVERKKYGQPGARKRFQFSKR